MKKSNVKEHQIPNNPLDRIAICMSGGGYRSAIFQLGILSYLNSVEYGENPLLKHVKAISTVSGGTITGVVYSAMLAKGLNFEKVYNTLLTWLSKKDLVHEGLEKVSKDGIWNHTYKRKNLINAFAEIYDESLTNGMCLGDLDGIWKKSHLEYVCFNATEFKKGLRFRFQIAKGARQNYVGAYELNLRKEVYHEIRLSDIIASSSAFSGGFEPIAMPSDFFGPDSEHKSYFESHSGYQGTSIGLMDGGIYDNQGISSIEDFQDNTEENQFDLIMICDVSSPYIDAFSFVSEKTGGVREMTLNQFFKFYRKKARVLYFSLWAATLVGLILTLLNLKLFTWRFGVGISITAIGIIAIILYHVLRSWVKVKFNNTWNYLKQLIPDFFEKRLPSFKLEHFKLKHLEILALDRFNSLKLLLPTIFLKQIRRLHYNRIYEDDAHYYRRMTCLVKELTKIDFKKKIEEDYSRVSKNLSMLNGNDYDKIMGEKLVDHIDEAATFGTTLWFTDSDKLNEILVSLLISGQATCCQNLMIYLDKLMYNQGNGFEKLDKKTKIRLEAIYKKTKLDWEKFKNDPGFLHNTLYNPKGI
ncbi:patatin-like phospholipase family protein [Flagellimonas sp. CMM7]|uniref:patatin-like phospholipase family protein n=1 Tax=Flagellimonas sp. CMM7 TaxID=2654676 RepID=UPI0013D6FC45|nr:patatin-like phospholipase family protein [Flagellimonas sp. CMM7]UII78587.1 patatin-like phospholipase family protein [Flagellimonas sp. CMM7]